MKIAVIAGTPVDTQMGAALLEARGLEVKGFPAAQTPWEQSLIQIGPQEEREAVVGKLLEAAREEGFAAALIYCNSLSATIDAPALSARCGLPLVTPMDVYGALARRYRRLGVMTANSQGAAGIERVMLRAAPETLVVSAANLALTLGIEEGLSPQALAERCGLTHLAAFFEANRVEAIVLGCTHFPYIKETLQSCTSLPVLDPDGELAERVLQAAAGGR